MFADLPGHIPEVVTSWRALRHGLRDRSINLLMAPLVISCEELYEAELHHMPKNCPEEGSSRGRQTICFSLLEIVDYGGLMLCLLKGDANLIWSINTFTFEVI